MTTIRKIVTSKIDGNSANNTTADEIRPFGETAFYVDTDGPTNKLVLSIHDGVRTHLKSKVVGPGVLYGSNADSGDGNNYDTIKLIPDAELQYNDGTYNNDQYLIVDPTAPNHIHLRAGGTIDNSNAALILGGENSNVEIQAGENPPVYVRANNNTWMFDTDGSLTLPTGVTNNGRIINDNGISLKVDSSYWTFGTNGLLIIPGDIQSENDVNITVDSGDSSSYTWNFGEDGDLSLPAGGIIRETIVTDNPTIELEPANADAASQKLIIKGGQAEEYHLHLTTGDLDETAIFLGTDDHHVKVGGLTGVSIKAKVGSYVTLVTSDDSENPDRYYLSLEPNGMVNFSGQYFNVVFPPDNSTGRTTDLQGMVAFNSGYIYYCTADYTDGLANIWKRVAWSADTW